MQKFLGTTTLFTATLIAGCASSPQPTMSINDHQKIGFAMATLTQCVANGGMDTYLASKGKGFLEAKLSARQHDPSLIRDAYNEQMSSGREPSRTDCAGIAMGIQGAVNTVNENNKMVDRENQEIRDAINNRPRNTYCNKFGTQVNCSTY